MKYIIQFKDGFLAPLRGAGFLFKHKRILSLSILPTCINFFLYAVMSYIAYANFAKILNYITIDPIAWYQYVLYYLTGLFLSILIVAVLVFSFTIVGNIIASPFNDIITRKVHFILGGVKIDDTGSGFKFLIKDLSRVANVEIKKIIFSLSVTGVAVLGGFIIPVLAILVWVVTMSFIAFQFIDYSLEINRKSFSYRVSFMFRKIFMMLGFGFSCSLFIAIPLIGFLFLPFAVVGAAQLYYKYENSN